MTVLEVTRQQCGAVGKGCSMHFWTVRAIGHKLLISNAVSPPATSLTISGLTRQLAAQHPFDFECWVSSSLPRQDGRPYFPGQLAYCLSYGAGELSSLHPLHSRAQTWLGMFFDSIWLHVPAHALRQGALTPVSVAASVELLQPQKTRKPILWVLF